MGTKAKTKRGAKKGGRTVKPAMPVLLRLWHLLFSRGLSAWMWGFNASSKCFHSAQRALGKLSKKAGISSAVTGIGSLLGPLLV